MIRKAKALTLLTALFIAMMPFMLSVREVRAQATIYIRPDGSIDPPTTPIQRVGDVYTFTDNIYDSIVVERNNVIVDGNGFTLQGTRSGTGFDLSNRKNVIIRNTHIAEWNYGIHVYNQSSGNNITNNNLTSNVQRAIFLSNSSSNTIRSNVIVGTVGEGIFLWRTNTTTITGNNVSNNGEDGISFGFSSFYNTIDSNTVVGNIQAGISFGWEVTTGNIITGNNITNSGWTGIYFDHSNGNAFYHNNLSNNTNQAVTVGATNNWDNGYVSGGNYWSDYTGLDSDGDGIVDTPRILDVDNQDNYPFVNPWTPQAHDITVTSVTPLKTVVGRGYDMNINVTMANQGSYTQTFNVTAYANTTAIETKTITLVNGNSETVTFTWNTTGVVKGNYTIIAVATTVPGEIHTVDNTLTNGMVAVLTPGDVNADGVVDILDLSGISAHWYPGPPIGPMGYDPNFDINGDGRIDILEVSILSAYWTGPPKGPLDP